MTPKTLEAIVSLADNQDSETVKAAFREGKDMSIVQRVSFYDFKTALRQDQYSEYSTEAIEAMFDWYEELSDGMDEPMELDVVAIRCTWSEYHVQELWDNYSNVFEREGLTESEDADDYNKQVAILDCYTSVLDVRRDTHMGNVVIGEF